jgi:hypothetical protein
METQTYRSNSTWFLHHLDPIIHNDFSCRPGSTEKPILAVPNPLRRKKGRKGLFLFMATTFKKHKSGSVTQII